MGESHHSLQIMNLDMKRLVFNNKKAANYYLGNEHDTVI